MLCEICGENEATFHYSEVVNGNKTEHHLCSECAAKTDISYYTNLLDIKQIGVIAYVRLSRTFTAKMMLRLIPVNNLRIVEGRLIFSTNLT